MTPTDVFYGRDRKIQTARDMIKSMSLNLRRFTNMALNPPEQQVNVSQRLGRHTRFFCPIKVFSPDATDRSEAILPLAKSEQSVIVIKI